VPPATPSRFQAEQPLNIWAKSQVVGVFCQRRIATVSSTDPLEIAMDSKHVTLKARSRSSQRGQGMSEYIIITALVAVAGIGLFAAFGDVLQNQLAGMSREMAGQSATQDITDAQTSATTAQNRAAQADSLSTYNQQTNAAQ
jgi:pilus assembly protein Flp/PilA